MAGLTFTRLRWRIAVPYAVLAAISLTAPGLYVGAVAREEAFHQLEADLAARAWRLTGEMRTALEQRGPGALAGLAADEGNAAGLRVTLIDADGKVLGDSQSDPQRMENHRDRPEVRAALSGQLSESQRHSVTLERDLLYLAAPVVQGAKLVGVVRVALTVQEVSGLVNQVAVRVLSAVAVAVVAAVAAAVGLAQLAVGSLKPVLEMAHRLTAGELAAAPPATTLDEPVRLVRALQRLAASVRTQLAVLEMQRLQTSVILEHFNDGVVVLDAERRVALANPSAEWLLYGGGPLAGRTVVSATAGDSEALQAVAAMAAEIAAPLQDSDEPSPVRLRTLDLPGGSLELAVTALPDPDGHRVLALIRDITRLRHAETVRRQFVAGVTPELVRRVEEVRQGLALMENDHDLNTEKNRLVLHQLDGELDQLTVMVTDMLERVRRLPGES
ncbi:MAG: PAS domain-containing protein [Chloroflexi bacterium]|nr:PAS domain-containing protein [Chloroflexota bacterium]